MAIKFQYNKTSLGELNKQLKIRKNALPTIKSKESALRSEVKRAKDSAQGYREQLDKLIAEYDYMVQLQAFCRHREACARERVRRRRTDAHSREQR